jgi:hypothetical protein
MKLDINLKDNISLKNLLLFSLSNITEYIYSFYYDILHEYYEILIIEKYNISMKKYRVDWYSI